MVADVNKNRPVIINQASSSNVHCCPVDEAYCLLIEGAHCSGEVTHCLSVEEAYCSGERPIVNLVNRPIVNLVKSLLFSC